MTPALYAIVAIVFGLLVGVAAVALWFNRQKNTMIDSAARLATAYRDARRAAIVARLEKARSAAVKHAQGADKRSETHESDTISLADYINTRTPGRGEDSTH